MEIEERVSPYLEETYNPSEKRVNDLIHTKLEVSFDWPMARMNGVATLTLKPYFHSTNELTLDAKGFDLHEVGIVQNGKVKTLKYEYDKFLLNIQLDRIYSRDETYQIFIDYTAKPNELPKGGSDAIISDKGLYFINQKEYSSGKKGILRRR